MSDLVNLSFSVTHDEIASFQRGLAELMSKEVLAGFPDDGKERTDENGNPEPINNASLAYIHDKGSPEQNIPARPFMEPGIESREREIESSLAAGAHAALDGNSLGLDQSLHAAGMAAKIGIQQKILEGPFAPLAEATLRARAAKGGSIGAAAQAELDGVQLVDGSPNVRPLNETGQMRNAATYAIRKVGETQ